MSSFYDLIGADQGTRDLVTRFYDLMETAPEAVEVRALHPTKLTVAREKLYEFLSGWLGGPPLFENKYGHPRLRARHLPFSIGAKERDQWMWCMTQALLKSQLPEADRLELTERFQQLATHMINREGEAPKLSRMVEK